MDLDGAFDATMQAPAHYILLTIHSIKGRMLRWISGFLWDAQGGYK